MAGALDGVRVLELARYQAGPRGGMLLSDLGAEVIKIEPPGGEETRRMPPMVRGQSVYFSVYNRGKKSVCLDLRHPRGKEVFAALVGKADIVLENFRPGVIARMGFAYERLRELNPGIILVSVSGFGQYGPYTDRPAFDPLGQAMGGLMSLTGQPEGKPIGTASSVVDRYTALHATIGALAALRHRERTGEGQVVDVCLLDSALTMVEIPTSYYLATGTEGGEAGRPPYRARDGWVVISAAAREMAARLMRVVDGDGTGVRDEPTTHDVPAKAGETATRGGTAPHGETAAPADTVAGLARPKRDEAPLAGGAGADARRARIEAWCASRTVEEICATLQETGVPVGPVRTIPEVARDPHLWERQMLVRADDPVAGEMYLPGLTIKMSRTPGQIGPVPTPGQHTDEILGRVLGHDAASLADLRSAGAIA